MFFPSFEEESKNSVVLKYSEIHTAFYNKKKNKEKLLILTLEETVL